MAEDFLAGTVDVPKIGKVKKAYVIVPLGLVGVYVAYRWWAAGTAEDDGPAASDGMYDPDLSDMGQSTGGGPSNVGGNTGAIDTDGTGPDSIDTNAEWTTLAVERLTNQGYDGVVVSNALGEFLARRSLDASEATIARAAVALAGEPPIGRPWTVIEGATGPGPIALAAPTGLKVVSTTTNSVTLSWNRVTGAGYYRAYRSGSSTNVGATDGTTITIGGLQPGFEYSFQVAADTTSNKPGPKSSSVKTRTKYLTLAKPTGLKASNITKTSFRVSCGEVKGATYYRWYLNGSPYGASDDPYRDFTSRKPNTSYKVTVAADVTNAVPGPQSTALTVKTKK